MRYLATIGYQVTGLMELTSAIIVEAALAFGITIEEAEIRLKQGKIYALEIPTNKEPIRLWVEV